MAIGYLQDGIQVTGHTHLVHTKDSAGAFRDGGLDQRRIDIERTRLDIDKHWSSATKTNAVRRGDEGMTDGDHLVPWLNPH